MRSSKLALAFIVVISGCDGRTEPGANGELSGLPMVEPATSEALPSEVVPSTGMAALDVLPWEERIGLEQVIAATDARYAPRMGETGPLLETPGSVVATFTASGAHLSAGGVGTTLRVAAIGRDGAMRDASASSGAEIVGAEVRNSRLPGVVEWWRSLPSGLEHGITVAERPAGEGELRVEVAVSGGLSAQLLSSDSVELRSASGEPVLTYARLVVHDATGARVPAYMAVDGDRIALGMDERDARYPLVIDPLVTAQEAMLVGANLAGDRLGSSVALSSDASRALVGAPEHDAGGVNAAGSASVFVRTGTTWALEATLLAPMGAVFARFGSSVALTSDGDRALVGASGAARAQVFLRTDTAWAHEAELAPGGTTLNAFGISVALSADGSRALVGATADGPSAGARVGSARVFLRTMTTWAPEATLLAPDGAAGDELGRSVALSADGSRAFVGAYNDDTPAGDGAGSVRVFRRTATTWAEEATLLGPDGATGTRFGLSVAVSADGGRVLVGGNSNNPVAGYPGTAHVFLLTGTVWGHEAMLAVPDAEGFGQSVALSADGSQALVGAGYDAMFAGSARVFVRTGTAWSNEAALLAPDAAANDELGASVALSADGTRALAGAPGDNGGIGSARVFTVALAPNGSSCFGDAACVSGFCMDGVCCDTRCGGGTTDCQACTGALTGGADGTCALLSPTAAPTVICRASTDLCDAAETCTSTSTTCPADVVASSSTVCRAATDLCDTAELCTGTSAACPADALAPSGTVCRAAATGTCDATELCDGASAACPADRVASVGTVCRATLGSCDPAEACDGMSAACPSDVRTPMGTRCGGMMGSCSTPGMCDGTSADCIGGDPLAAGTVCMPAAPGSACDVPDVCDGSTDACRAMFMAAGASCGPAPSGPCDALDVCTGTSGDCMPTFLAGTECRASSGGCDPAEVCAGGEAACPPDAIAPTGTVCRASTESCDPAESCDGTAASCPADIDTCMPRVDTGARDGGGADGGVPAPVEGCRCRAGSRTAPFAPGISLLVLVALGWRRRGRR